MNPEIEAIINARAYQRAKQEGLVELTECQHPRHEMRKRVLRNNSVQYVRQCLTCGLAVGTPVSHAKVSGNPPLFDEKLARGATAEDMARFREIERQEFWAWYNDYLNSETWAQRRQAVMQRDHGVCQGCLGGATQVHHLTYEHVGQEFLFELVAICASCHHRLHDDD